MSEYKVIGSRGTEYTIVIKGIRFSCTCMAGHFGNLCKHVRQAAKEHDEKRFNEVMERCDRAEEQYKGIKKESEAFFSEWRDDPSESNFEQLKRSCEYYRTAAKKYFELKSEFGMA